jgi:hypothetical protein
MHISIKFKTRAEYIKFIRSVTAHLVLALSTFFNQNLKGLFDLRPWTRVIHWGKAFFNLIKYIKTNDRESKGHITERMIKKWDRDLDKILKSSA